MAIGKEHRTFAKKLYKDKIIWMQIFLCLLFYVNTCLWIPVTPRYIKLTLGYGESYVGVSSLVLALSAIASRPLVSKYGPKINKLYLMLLAYALLIIAALVFILQSKYSFTNPIYPIFFSRAMIGIAEGLFYVAIASLILANSNSKNKGLALSLYTFGVWMGIAIGPAIGERFYHISTTNYIYYAAIFNIVSLVVMSIYTIFLPYRVQTSGENKVVKKRAAICKPVLLPGLIFTLGISTWIGVESFAPLFARTLGVKDVTTFFLIAGLGILASRLILAKQVDKRNNKILISIALISSICASTIFSISSTSIGLYSGLFFILISQGLFYPSIIMISLKRAHDYDEISILGTQALFFEMAFGFLPLIFGYIIQKASYVYMFRSTVVAVVIALLLIVLLKVPKYLPDESLEQAAINEPDALV
ncbi:MAG: MFS transporter [Acidimicrobiia bacterium]